MICIAEYYKGFDDNSAIDSVPTLSCTGYKTVVISGVKAFLVAGQFLTSLNVAGGRHFQSLRTGEKGGVIIKNFHAASYK